MRAELFLRRYRVLEGLLERRYEGRKLSSNSVIMEYSRDADSEDVRVDLDLLREIRNILSHNADANGDPVVEPSQETLDKLDEIIDHVKKPMLAVDFGTPSHSILFANMNDRVFDVMRSMQKKGYSHVPIRGERGVSGVFSIKSVFDYLVANGACSLGEDARIVDLGSRIRLNSPASERYLFLPADTTVAAVRKEFEHYSEKNRRLNIVFITQHGQMDEDILCILTPWDVLSIKNPHKEINENGKRS